MDKDYWISRFDQIEQSANNQTVRFKLELEAKYRRAMQDIDGKINAWYQRFAINNRISMAEAKKLLNSRELEELRWNVKDYIRHGKENELEQAWLKQLENASAKFHINRLEALKIECQQSLEVAMGGRVDDTDTLIRSVYSDTYYKSCFIIQKGIGIGFDVGKLNHNLINRIIKKPWAMDGRNFSDRLWTDKVKLINTLDQELTRMVLTTNTPDKAIKAIKTAMNTSAYNAARIVQTEQAYFTTLAQSDSYKELDVDEYEIIATLDGLTCKRCGSHDGEHHNAKDMNVGINAPPFHPLCRCTTAPYFDDMVGYRASRTKEGETVFDVPSNMTYNEWIMKQGLL